MFNNKRLRIARFRAGMTKSQLASAVGVSRMMIHKYEAEQSTPKQETLEIIAKVTGYPIEFFSAGQIDEPNSETASFRSMSNMVAANRDAALAAGSLAFLLGDWVEGLFDLPAPDVMDLGAEVSPESAARALREIWNLGSRPIKNMIQLLEAKGVRIFSLVEESRSVDAFSIWRNDKPYIFLNTIKTAEHSRFDTAHELGHLVLHRHGGPAGREAEDQANRFAASFLMPKDDVVANAPRVDDVRQIIDKKVRWKVSAFALNYRLHKLDIVSEWQYRQFCIQLSQQGYRTGEPNGISREKSVVWEKVFAGLRSERVTKHDIAAALHIPAAEIEKLVFGLASMMSYDGHGEGRSSPSGQLRLVS